MNGKAFQLLTPHEVEDLWPTLEPWVEKACKSNEIAAQDLNAKDVFLHLVMGLQTGFLLYNLEGEPELLIVIEFVEYGPKRGAEIVVMGGRNLVTFTKPFDIVVEWLKEQGAQFVDAHANSRLANIYRKRFGFTKSCEYLRREI